MLLLSPWARPFFKSPRRLGRFCQSRYKYWGYFPRRRWEAFLLAYDEGDSAVNRFWMVT